VIKLKFELDDVMTTQEAGERWNVPADSIKQCCLKRYANKQFTDDEARKSGKNWLVTRQGMERLYGEEVLISSETKDDTKNE
jgi:hypothetical protein